MSPQNQKMMKYSSKLGGKPMVPADPTLAAPNRYIFKCPCGFTTDDARVEGTHRLSCYRRCPTCGTSWYALVNGENVLPCPKCSASVADPTPIVTERMRSKALEIFDDFAASDVTCTCESIFCKHNLEWFVNHTSRALAQVAAETRQECACCKIAAEGSRKGEA